MKWKHWLYFISDHCKLGRESLYIINMFSSSVFIDEEVPRMLLWREEEALGSSLFLVMVSLPERQERQVLCVSRNQAAVLRPELTGSRRKVLLKISGPWCWWKHGCAPKGVILLCESIECWRVRCALLAEDKAALSSVGMKMVNLFTVSCGFYIDLGPNCISWKRLSSPGPSGNIHSWKNPTTVTCWSGAGCVTRPDTALQAPQCSWRSSSCSCGVR